jgi:hypothetical protein
VPAHREALQGRKGADLLRQILYPRAHALEHLRRRKPLSAARLIPTAASFGAHSWLPCMALGAKSSQNTGMCLQAARAKAEELMQQAIESELAVKSQLEMEQQRLQDIDNDLDLDREKLRQERDALEGMRIDFEHELLQAKGEVAKAQDALKTAEERVHSAEQVEKQKIISGAATLQTCGAHVLPVGMSRGGHLLR